LGYRTASNYWTDSLRECQRRPRDSHLRLYDSNLRSAGHIMSSRSYVAGFAAKGPEIQNLKKGFEGARTVARSPAYSSSSLCV